MILLLDNRNSGTYRASTGTAGRAAHAAPKTFMIAFPARPVPVEPCEVFA
jgi:hypothetical protein